MRAVCEALGTGDMITTEASTNPGAAADTSASALGGGEVLVPRTVGR
jgi:hypothetical protein